MKSSPLPFDQSSIARARRKRLQDEELARELAEANAQFLQSVVDAKRQFWIVVILVAVCVLVTVVIVWTAVTR